MQLIPSITDSQAKLIGAANEYYRSRISVVEELKLKASMPAAEWDQQARLKNAELVMQEIKAKVDAAVSAAQSLGTRRLCAQQPPRFCIGLWLWFQLGVVQQ